MLLPSLVQKTFSKIAASYHAAAIIYHEASDRLLTHLDYVRVTPARILDLGAGTGYITELLQKRYPYAELIAVDFAEEMLHACRSRLACVSSQQEQIVFLNADAAALPLSDSSLDLVISGMMLPWCENNEMVFSEVMRVLKPNGLFLFSTFGPDTLGEVRAAWASVDELPHVHLFFDLHDVGDALLRAGFSDPVMQTEWLTLRYQHTKTLFRDLKNTGSINILSERRATLTGKKQFQQFLAEYETYRESEGKLPATFEIVYGHCWKQTKKIHKTPAEIVIPVDMIKNTSRQT